MSSCGCKSTPADSPQRAVLIDPTISFISDYKIPQMDCSSEEQLIRMKLANISQIQQLKFDLPQRKLTVWHQDRAEEITTALESLRLGAECLQTVSATNPAEISYTTCYHISQMDCPAEEQMIRMALAPLKHIQHLTFDLKQRTLEVQHSGDTAAISSALEQLHLSSTLQSSSKIHASTPVQNSPEQQRRVLLALLAINAVLFIVELVTGILASSTGLIADSLDMFADAAVYGIALYAVGKAQKYQLQAAHISGWLQILLALMVISDVIRRFIFGSEPGAGLMMIISLIALAGNAYCLYLISGHKEDGVHMQASWIFSSNDVLVNVGVIVAGILVYVTQSAYPDLIIGSIVAVLVFKGACKILALK